MLYSCFVVSFYVILFHPRLSSIEVCLPSKGSFHARLSSIKAKEVCIPYYCLFLFFPKETMIYSIYATVVMKRIIKIKIVNNCISCITNLSANPVSFKSYFIVFSYKTSDIKSSTPGCYTWSQWVDGRFQCYRLFLFIFRGDSLSRSHVFTHSLTHSVSQSVSQVFSNVPLQSIPF